MVEISRRNSVTKIVFSGTALPVLEGCCGNYLVGESVEGGSSGLLELLLLATTEAGG